jgi:hypothetical protein
MTMSSKGVDSPTSIDLPHHHHQDTTAGRKLLLLWPEDFYFFSSFSSDCPLINNLHFCFVTQPQRRGGKIEDKNIWRFLESIRLSILASRAGSKENYKRE